MCVVLVVDPYYMCVGLRRQEEESDHLELELLVISQHLDTGSRTWVVCVSSQCHLTIHPSLPSELVNLVMS